MILGLKIGVGIVLGFVIVNLAFWLCVILVYGIVTLVECLSKWWLK